MVCDKTCDTVKGWAICQWNWLMGISLVSILLCGITISSSFETVGSLVNFQAGSFSAVTGYIAGATGLAAGVVSACRMENKGCFITSLVLAFLMMSAMISVHATNLFGYGDAIEGGSEVLMWAAPLMSFAVFAGLPALCALYHNKKKKEYKIHSAKFEVGGTARVINSEKGKRQKVTVVQVLPDQVKVRDETGQEFVYHRDDLQPYEPHKYEAAYGNTTGKGGVLSRYNARQEEIKAHDRKVEARKRDTQYDLDLESHSLQEGSPTNLEHSTHHGTVPAGTVEPNTTPETVRRLIEIHEANHSFGTVFASVFIFLFVTIGIYIYERSLVQRKFFKKHNTSELKYHAM